MLDVTVHLQLPQVVHFEYFEFDNFAVRTEVRLNQRRFNASRPSISAVYVDE